MRFEELHDLSLHITGDKLKAFHHCFPNVHRAYEYFCSLDDHNHDNQVDDLYSRLDEYILHLETCLSISTIRNYMMYMQIAWKRIPELSALFSPEIQDKIASSIENHRKKFTAITNSDNKKKRIAEYKNRNEKLQQTQPNNVSVLNKTYINDNDENDDDDDDHDDHDDDGNSDSNEDDDDNNNHIKKDRNAEVIVNSDILTSIEVSMRDISDQMTAMKKTYDFNIIENARLMKVIVDMNAAKVSLHIKVKKIITVYVKDTDMKDMIFSILDD
jgi:hypothetical protein